MQPAGQGRGRMRTKGCDRSECPRTETRVSSGIMSPRISRRLISAWSLPISAPTSALGVEGRLGGGGESGTDDAGSPRVGMVSSLRSRMRYEDFFVRDPKVGGAQTIFKGTRVTLRTVLASLADGDSTEMILKAYPSLTMEHVRAAIAFAAASAAEDLPPHPAPFSG